MSEERDKLQVVVDALRHNPSLTDRQIADLLGLSRSYSATFWRIKAQSLLGQGSFSSRSRPDRRR